MAKIVMSCHLLLDDETIRPILAAQKKPRRSSQPDSRFKVLKFHPSYSAVQMALGVGIGLRL